MPGVGRFVVGPHPASPLKLPPGMHILGAWPGVGAEKTRAGRTGWAVLGCETDKPSWERRPPAIHPQCVYGLPWPVNLPTSPNIFHGKFPR